MARRWGLYARTSTETNPVFMRHSGQRSLGRQDRTPAYFDYPQRTHMSVMPCVSLTAVMMKHAGQENQLGMRGLQLRQD